MTVPAAPRPAAPTGLPARRSRAARAPRLSSPARPSADGDHPVPAQDVGHPELLDDAVDEVIETVLQRGGGVALLQDGALPPEHGRVALTLRRW